MDVSLELRVQRKLAVEYRERALREPDMASTLIDIANNLESAALALATEQQYMAARPARAEQQGWPAA